VTLTVDAVGGTAFQWQKNEVDIAGATGASHTILNLSTNDAGSYRVKVSNAAGSVFSDPAVLTVTPCPPIPATRWRSRPTAQSTIIRWTKPSRHDRS